MGQLKDQMLMEMRLRNFSPSTIKAYVWYVANFTKHFGKSPDRHLNKTLKTKDPD